MKIKSIKSYNNIKINKFLIYKDNNNKAGIYCLTNLITGSKYIGLSKNLGCRFNTYFSKKSISKYLESYNSAIYTDILKYGYENFQLDILEYCDYNELVSKEQYYIAKLQPEYNINKKMFKKNKLK